MIEELDPTPLGSLTKKSDSKKSDPKVSVSLEEETKAI